jgi:hypothetical protein
VFMVDSVFQAIAYCNRMVAIVQVLSFHTHEQKQNVVLQCKNPTAGARLLEDSVVYRGRLPLCHLSKCRELLLVIDLHFVLLAVILPCLCPAWLDPGDQTLVNANTAFEILDIHGLRLHSRCP